MSSNLYKYQIERARKETITENSNGKEGKEVTYTIVLPISAEKLKEGCEGVFNGKEGKEVTYLIVLPIRAEILEEGCEGVFNNLLHLETFIIESHMRDMKKILLLKFGSSYLRKMVEHLF